MDKGCMSSWHGRLSQTRDVSSDATLKMVLKGMASMQWGVNAPSGVKGSPPRATALHPALGILAFCSAPPPPTKPIGTHPLARGSPLLQ